jgi:hypothetical protein
VQSKREATERWLFYCLKEDQKLSLTLALSRRERELTALFGRGTPT